ncbi:Short chain dehydrogenase sol3 [Mycena venus]|uniref:Short chain dehydrogenase sol3 n=1 Tax=Mycena venus TaxID=2733690 RepID=A0A8H6U2U1_9AGAR|nr:Short chain dehydrogenase sol3 [Mycena venus]
MQLTFPGFLGRQFTKQAPVVNADLTSKTVIVLGANTGLGFEATKHFATMNPERLILACRSQSRGQNALDTELNAATGYSKAELWIVDLGDFESVKQFADKFERDGGRLDILVANAALSVRKYEATKDGWESSLQVNDLSTPLLAFLLLPAMIKTAEQYSTIPRLVVVASEVHHWVKIEKKVLENPDMIKTLGSSEYCTPKIMSSRYMLTKLLNVFFVRALNARLPSSTPLVIDAVNPGLCRSELMREAKGIQALLVWVILRIVAFSAEEGSQVEEVSDFVLSPQGIKAQNQLWDELVEILGTVDPRVTAIVNKYLSSTPA